MWAVQPSTVCFTNGFHALNTIDGITHDPPVLLRSEREGLSIAIHETLEIRSKFGTQSGRLLSSRKFHRFPKEPCLGGTSCILGCSRVLYCRPSLPAILASIGIAIHLRDEAPQGNRAPHKSHFLLRRRELHGPQEDFLDGRELLRHAIQDHPWKMGRWSRN